MTPHDRIRHDQSLALRDSLLGSSFSWLTLAVAFLIAATFRSAPVVDCPVIPDWDPLVRTIDDWVPAPDGGAAPAPVPPAVLDGRLLPVADALETAALPPSETIAEPSTPGLDGVGPGTDPGIGTATDGGIGSAAGAIPSHEIWIYHDVAPEAVTRVTPEYPELARQARLEGRVVVRAFVGPDGRVRRAEVETSSPAFDDAATTAVRRWVFTPALANGHAVGVWVRVPVVFRLD